MHILENIDILQAIYRDINRFKWTQLHTFTVIYFGVVILWDILCF